MPSIVVLSGNPRAASRTTLVAEHLARAVADIIPAPVRTVELADAGSRVLQHGDPSVAELREVVASAALLIVATPVYKGSYTGLLKAFLDGFGPTSLQGVAAVPVVVAASPAHLAIAGEFHLRPLLHEIGAQTPLGVLAVAEAQAGEASERAALVDAWVGERRHLLGALRTGALA